MWTSNLRHSGSELEREKRVKRLERGASRQAQRDIELKRRKCGYHEAGEVGARGKEAERKEAERKEVERKEVERKGPRGKGAEGEEGARSKSVRSTAFVDFFGSHSHAHLYIALQPFK